jgi:hypothetical protein
MKALFLAPSAAVAAIVIALGGAIPAHADVHFSDYYADLRKHGILVDGNEKYLADLAMIVCQMRNAGYKLGDVGDYIAQRESIPNIKGFDIAMLADGDVCTQLHPRLVP